MNLQPTTQPGTITANWNLQANGTALTTPIYLGNAAPITVPPTPPPPSRADRLRSRLQCFLQGEPFVLPADMPPIGGAAREAETEKRVEVTHKKKIILERKVGARRPDVKDGQETHKGTVELVRTLSGNENEVGTIGIKSSGDSSGFVEVPLEDLLSAVEELRDSVPPKA